MNYIPTAFAEFLNRRSESHTFTGHLQKKLVENADLKENLYVEVDTLSKKVSIQHMKDHVKIGNPIIFRYSKEACAIREILNILEDLKAEELNFFFNYTLLFYSEGYSCILVDSLKQALPHLKNESMVKQINYFLEHYGKIASVQKDSRSLVRAIQKDMPLVAPILATYINNKEELNESLFTYFLKKQKECKPHSLKPHSFKEIKWNKEEENVLRICNLEGDDFHILEVFPKENRVRSAFLRDVTKTAYKNSYNYTNEEDAINWMINETSIVNSMFGAHSKVRNIFENVLKRYWLLELQPMMYHLYNKDTVITANINKELNRAIAKLNTLESSFYIFNQESQVFDILDEYAPTILQMFKDLYINGTTFDIECLSRLLVIEGNNV